MSYGNDWNSSRYSGDGRIGFVTVMGFLACALCLVSVFLPFVKVPEHGLSIVLMQTEDGIFFIIFSVVGAILFLLKRRFLPLLPTLMLAYSTLAMVINVISDLVSIAGISPVLIQKGVGYYLLIAGTILLAVSAVIRLFIRAGRG